MTTFDPQNRKAVLSEGSNEVGPCDAGSPAHAAIVTRCMPMNSKSCFGAPSTSRHSSMASRIRSVTGPPILYLPSLCVMLRTSMTQ